MTPEQLAKIEKRAEAATNGPWSCRQTSMPGEVLLEFGDRSIQMPAFDAFFVADSRSDVPVLCRALRDAWVTIKELKDDKDTYGRGR